MNAKKEAALAHAMSYFMRALQETGSIPIVVVAESAAGTISINPPGLSSLGILTREEWAELYPFDGAGDLIDLPKAQ